MRVFIWHVSSLIEDLHLFDVTQEPIAILLTQILEQCLLHMMTVRQSRENKKTISETCLMLNRVKTSIELMESFDFEQIGNRREIWHHDNHRWDYKRDGQQMHSTYNTTLYECAHWDDRKCVSDKKDFRSFLLRWTKHDRREIDKRHFMINSLCHTGTMCVFSSFFL